MSVFRSRRELIIYVFNLIMDILKVKVNNNYLTKLNYSVKFNINYNGLLC